MRDVAAGRSSGRYDGLVLALMASTPGFLLPWALQKFVLPAFERADSLLPAVTQAWLAVFPLAFALPVLVLVAWRMGHAHPHRDRIALALGAGGSVLFDAFSIVAVWQLIVDLPGAV